MAEMFSTTAVCFLLLSLALTMLNIFVVSAVLIAFVSGVLFISEPIRCIIKMKDVKTSNPIGFNGIMLIRLLGWLIVLPFVFMPVSLPLLSLFGVGLILYTVNEEEKIHRENGWK